MLKCWIVVGVIATLRVQCAIVLILKFHQIYKLLHTFFISSKACRTSLWRVKRLRNLVHYLQYLFLKLILHSVIILFFTGSIPLRQLVYRVHPLPESMRPLVWDFGQLTDHAEELYTAQIVRRFMVSPTPDVSNKTNCCLKLNIQDKGFPPFILLKRNNWCK